MSNKINFPNFRASKSNGNNNKQFDGAVPPQMNPMKVELNTLDSFHCPNCKNSAFNTVYQHVEVPALLANHPSGQPQMLKIELLLCVRCGAVWHVSQLSRMTATEREILRVEMEMKADVNVDTTWEEQEESTK
jgi:hypothetical protein